MILPYAQGVPETVRRILAPLGVNVAFQPNSTLKRLLVRPKDRIPSEKSSGVVYQIPCASCPATYVGQTGWQLGQRIKEYRQAVDSGDCISSAIAEHAWGSHHPVDWDHVRVLDHHPVCTRD